MSDDADLRENLENLTRVTDGMLKQLNGILAIIQGQNEMLRVVAEAGALTSNLILQTMAMRPDVSPEKVQALIQQVQDAARRASTIGAQAQARMDNAIAKPPRKG